MVITPLDTPCLRNSVSNSKAIPTRCSFLQTGWVFLAVSPPLRNNRQTKWCKKKNARPRIGTGVQFRSTRELRTDFLRLRSAFIKHIDTLANARVDSIRIQTVLRKEQFGISMSYQTIRD